MTMAYKTKDATFEILSSGQPFPYSDHHYSVRVTFPEPKTEAEARAICADSQMGYCSVTRTERAHWSDSYLEYFYQQDKEGRVWRYNTITPYAG